MQQADAQWNSDVDSGRDEATGAWPINASERASVPPGFFTYS